MKFKVEKTSDYNYNELVQIDTIEDLFQIMKSSNAEAIILTIMEDEELPIIEIFA